MAFELEKWLKLFYNEAGTNFWELLKEETQQRDEENNEKTLTIKSWEIVMSFFGNARFVMVIQFFL